MADTKITALSALTAADPANDVLPIVDVNDPFMAASGTTKKISINNILGASGTATLASATISGDLTVDTSTLKVDSANNRVGIGTATPGTACDVASGTVRVKNAVGDTSGLLIYQDTGDASKIFNYYNGSMQFGINNTTAMILNSIGLGVGGAPVNPLTVFAAASAKAPALLLSTAGSPTYGWDFSVDGAVNGNLFIRSLIGGTKTDVLEFDRATGNVGIGVTPSYKLHVNGRVSYSTGIGEGADLTLSSTGTQVQHGISSTWTSQNFYTGGTSRVVMKQNGQVRFVPLAADPAGAEAGDVYYNSTSNKLKCYNGTTWNDLF